MLIFQKKTVGFDENATEGGRQDKCEVFVTPES